MVVSAQPRLGYVHCLPCKEERGYDITLYEVKENTSGCYAEIRFKRHLYRVWGGPVWVACPKCHMPYSGALD